MITRTTLAAMAIAIPMSISSAAGAQERTGLPLDALEPLLTSQGLALGRVLVPETEGAPVRVEIRRAQDVVALADVRVCTSVETARIWAAERAETASTTELVARRSPQSVADTATGRASILVLVRYNVGLVVRAIADDVDAARIAGLAVIALDDAPRGAPMAAAIPTPQMPRSLPVGESAPVAIPSGLAAVRVIATGDAYARNTPNGWFVTRTGTGDFVVRITGVDRMLRTTR